MLNVRIRKAVINSSQMRRTANCRTLFGKLADSEQALSSVLASLKPRCAGQRLKSSQNIIWTPRCVGPNLCVWRWSPLSLFANFRYWIPSSTCLALRPTESETYVTQGARCESKNCYSQTPGLFYTFLAPILSHISSYLINDILQIPPFLYPSLGLH